MAMRALVVALALGACAPAAPVRSHRGEAARVAPPPRPAPAAEPVVTVASATPPNTAAGADDVPPPCQKEQQWSGATGEPRSVTDPAGVFPVFATAAGTYIHLAQRREDRSGEQTIPPTPSSADARAPDWPLHVLRHSTLTADERKKLAKDEGIWEVFRGDRLSCSGRVTQVERVSWVRGPVTGDLACFPEDAERSSLQPGSIEAMYSTLREHDVSDLAGRLSGCEGLRPGGWLWARRKAASPPLVSAFQAADAPTKLAKESAEVAAWREARRCVEARYREGSHGTAAVGQFVSWSSGPRERWTSVHSQIGNTYIGAGPDEANMWDLWHTRADKTSDDLLLRTVLPHAKRVVPIYIGDFDGAGELALFFLVNHTGGDSLVFATLKDGKLVPRSELRIHRYCPS
jgi:hypothetical protein